jgi:uncharacterized membrane protein
MLKDSLTEILYIMMGIVSFYSAYATLKEKNHPSKWTYPRK